MTIVVITSLYRPLHRGGAEVVVETIVDELKKQNRVVVITTTSWRGFRSLRAHMTEEQGVRVYRYYPFNVFDFFEIENNKPFFLRFLWHILDTVNLHSYCMVSSILKKEKPDIVMTHNLKGISYSIIHAIRRLGFFHIHTMHDVQLIAPSGVVYVGQDRSKWFRARAAFFSFFHRAIFGSPPVVVFSSRFLKSFYERWNYFPQSRNRVLPNPISCFAFRADTDREESYQKRLALWASGTRVFLYLGLLKKQKGIFLLLNAFRALPNHQAQLLICGSGHALQRVRTSAYTDQRIQILGHVDRSTLPEILKKTHFMVIPSLLYENSPMVLYESFSAGIPVIVSESGGASELVKDGENGYIVPAGDEHALTQALVRSTLLKDQQYKRMCVSAQASVADFSVENYCKKLLMYYFELRNTYIETGEK